MLDAALGHALDFRTWHALVTDGRVTRAEAIELMRGLVDAAGPASS